MCCCVKRHWYNMYYHSICIQFSRTENTRTPSSIGHHLCRRIACCHGIAFELMMTLDRIEQNKEDFYKHPFKSRFNFRKIWKDPTPFCNGSIDSISNPSVGYILCTDISGRIRLRISIVTNASHNIKFNSYWISIIYDTREFCVGEIQFCTG